MSGSPDSRIDWSVTTYEGARREQLRRWAELPLIEILTALEEMEMLAARLGGTLPAVPRPQETDSGAGKS